MPFFGSDWRAPGDKWIRTEFGWKRLCDLHSTFQRQLGRVASSVVTPAWSATVRRSSAIIRGRSRSPGSSASTTCSSSRASSRANSPGKRKSGLNEQRLKFINLSLAQRCVSVSAGSRESNRYATISDAINKLNFSHALQDANCYPFICKVLEALFEEKYWTLSGSMQRTLLRLTSTAKDIAMECQQHTGYVMSLMNKEIMVLERGFSLLQLDTVIKNLLSSRVQLVGDLQRDRAVELPCLSKDCWRHIISFLDHPNDVLNLRCVSSTHYLLTSEHSVWKSLIEYHYGKQQAHDIQPDMRTFREIYLLNEKRLKPHTSYAVVLCKVCNFIYWRDYGHPCTLPSCTGTSPQLTQCSESTAVLSGLTAQQFLTLFQC